MSPKDKREREDFESRVKAIDNLVLQKLDIQNRHSNTTLKDDKKVQESESLAVPSFRASWDFDQKWKNKS